MEKLERVGAAYRKPGYVKLQVRKAGQPALVEPVDGEAIEDGGTQ